MGKMIVRKPKSGAKLRLNLKKRCAQNAKEKNKPKKGGKTMRKGRRRNGSKCSRSLMKKFAEPLKTKERRQRQVSQKKKKVFARSLKSISTRPQVSSWYHLVSQLQVNQLQVSQLKVSQRKTKKRKTQRKTKRRKRQVSQKKKKVVREEPEVYFNKATGE